MLAFIALFLVQNILFFHLDKSIVARKGEGKEIYNFENPPEDQFETTHISKQIAWLFTQFVTLDSQ